MGFAAAKRQRRAMSRAANLCRESVKPKAGDFGIDDGRPILAETLVQFFQQRRKRCVRKR